MTTTPEGKMKRRIKEVLDKYRSYGIYVYMPVPYGYGRSTVDYLGFFLGRGFAIEAKASAKQKPTERQEVILAQIEASGAMTFVVNDDASLAAMELWFDRQVFSYKLHG